jgi:hypothetical protein
LGLYEDFSLFAYRPGRTAYRIVMKGTIRKMSVAELVMEVFPAMIDALKGP